MGALQWRAALLGFVLAVSLVVLLGRAVSAGAPPLGAVYQFVAIFVAAFAAGKLAEHDGVVQGLAVAILYIIAVATWSAWVDYDTASRFGPSALGSLDLGDIVVGDLVTLTAGMAGGWAGAPRRTR